MLMNMKSLLKFVPAVAMLCATGFMAQAAATPVAGAMSIAPAKIMQKSAVRPLDLQEGESIFTYVPDGLYYGIGSQTAESYDAAIKLDGKAFAGAKVAGIQFQLMDAQYTTGVKGWTSTELAETPTGEVIDVADEDLEVYSMTSDGFNEVRFTTPVEIPADGLYCGYSLTVTRVVASNQATGYPIATGSDSDMYENGFFLRDEKLTGGEWKDMYGQAPALTLRVILTDLPAGANIELPDYVIAKQGEASQAKVTVYKGASSLQIEYTYEVAGKQGTGTATNDNANEMYGSANDVMIDLPAIDEIGEYDLKVKVTKVNGEENTGDNIEATTKLVVTNLDIKHRAVVEEYTGAWCPNCPRGYVAMEYMAEKYPDDFIGLAYHYNDPMQGTNVIEPSSISGWPSAYLDRASGEIDPYFGSGENEMDIEQDWLDRCEEPSPAAIEVEAALSDDLETVSVTSRTAFALQVADGFKVAYALLADGLTGTGTSWKQANNYRGYSSALDIDAWDQFFNGGSRVEVPFNDVVILAPDIMGVAGSVPEEIRVGEWNDHEYTFTLSKATSAYSTSRGESLVQKLWKLRVVAMLLNAEGEIVNAAKCSVSVPAGVNGVESTMDEAVEVARYSLDGRLLSEPERGVNLVKMSDGTVRKVMVK